MRTLVLICLLGLGLNLAACATSDFEKWRQKATAECNAKTDRFERQNCLEQIEAVVRQRQLPQP